PWPPNDCCANSPNSAAGWPCRSVSVRGSSTARRSSACPETHHSRKTVRECPKIFGGTLVETFLKRAKTLGRNQKVGKKWHSPKLKSSQGWQRSSTKSPAWLARQSKPTSRSPTTSTSTPAR